MKALNHVFIHIRQYGVSHRPLYLASLMLFFWSIFDGIMSFTVPLLITQSGYSASMMGLILASSSIAGAGFDFLLARFMQETHYRRVYLVMFGLAFAFPLVLNGPNVIWVYLIAMAIWGLYYDLANFASFDFVGRESRPEEHADSFGVVGVFRAAGYMLAPLIAGFLIGTLVETKVFVVALIFLGVAFLVYLALAAITKRRRTGYLKTIVYKHRNMAVEVKIWKRVANNLLPMLLFTLMLNIYDAFFWSIGPLFSEGLPVASYLKGLVLAAYSLPSLIVGWFVGRITQRYGEVRSAYLSFLAASLFLLALPFTSNFWLITLLIFASSALSTIAFVAIKAYIADRVTSAPAYEKEIEGLGDFSTNLGYVVGPLAAGVLAEKVGSAWSFLALGVLGVAASFVLTKKS